MTNASRTELEPMSHLISSLLRRAWIIILVTALVGAAAWFLTGLSEDPVDKVTASSRVGITTEAVWPFYDVVLEQGRMMIDRPEFLPALGAELGYPVESIRTTIPDKLSVFDIEVEADSAAHAVAAADRAAAMVVEQGTEQANQDTLDAIASLDIELAELDGRIATIRAEMDTQTARITEITALQAVEYDNTREEQRYALSLERDVNQAIVTDLERERTTKISQRSNRAAAAAPDALYQVLRLAETPDASSSARLPITLAAALAAMLVACAVAVSLDRRSGPVRTTWQLRNVCGARETAEVTAQGSALRGAGAIADQLHRAMSNDQHVIGLLDATGRGLDLTLVPHHLAEHGFTTTLAHEPHRVPGNDVSFVNVTAEYADDDTPRVRSRKCDTVLVFVDNRTSVKKATSVIERTEAAPGVLSTFLVRSSR